MAIQMLAAWNGYEQHAVYTLSNAEETRLIGLGLARNYTSSVVPPGVRGDAVVFADNTLGYRDDANGGAASPITTGSGSVSVNPATGRIEDVVQRGAVAEVLDRVSVEDYYQASDGSDWLPAFTRAQAAGRNIILRSNTEYTLSRPVRNISNRRWIGGGPSTRVRNARTAGSNALHGAFMLGNIHPAMFGYGSAAAGKLPCYDISPVAAGAIAVGLVNSGDAAIFSVGQFVCVRHVTEITFSGASYPLYVHFAKVVSIAGSTVELDRPVLDAIASACISPVGSTVDPFMGYTWEFVEGVTIENMTVDARGIASTRTGAYGCVIKDINVENCDHLLAVNAFVDTVVSNLRGTVSDRLLELKCYSQGNTFSDIRGRLSGAGANTTVDIGEQSNRNRLSGVRMTIPSSATALVECIKINGFRNSVSESEFVHLGSTAGQAVATIPGNNFTGYGPNGNTVRTTRLVSSAARTHHIIIGTSGATENPQNYVLDDIETVGATSSSRSLRVAAGGVGGRVIASTMAYQDEVATGASAPSYVGTSAGGIAAASMLTTSATPEGAVSANPGTIIQRVGDQVAYPAMVKTGSSVNQGWRRLRTIGGVSRRFATDTNVALNSASTEIQDFVEALPFDCAVNLFSVSNLDAGYPLRIIKRNNTGAGRVQARVSGTTIAEIGAAERGELSCYYDGTEWRCNKVLYD